MKRFLDKAVMKRAVLAAKGKIPFDRYFYNARLVDMYTQRIIENASLGVVDGVIASVCPTFDVQSTESIDCEGMYLAPSFIDAHMHIESSGLTPFAYCQGAVPHGTGCIFHDPMQILNTSGMAGVRAFEDMLEELPVESGLELPTFARVLSGCDAVAFGETDGGSIESEELIGKLCEAAKSGMVINGHCPSMGYDDLCGAACAGLADDHECVSFEELCQRLQCGMSVMIRQGTIENDCQPLITGVVKNSLPTDSLMFCTDDKSPKDIKENGCIDNALRIAVKCGLDPVKAIAMATLNAARHFHADNIIGSCTPGRKANFVLLDDIEKMNVRKVFYEGRLVAENGKMAEIKSYPTGRYSCFDSSVRLPEALTEEDMTVSLPTDAQSAEAVVISMPEGILTKGFTAKIAVKNGKPVADVCNDILPVIVADRSGKSSECGRGFIHGLGIKRGAVASSGAQEGCAAVAAGVSPRDMLAALREVERMGGGAVICIGGRIAARQELSVGGILSPLDIDERIAESAEFAKALTLTGSDNAGLMTLLTVAPCSTIPDIGLTVKGLVDVAAGSVIPPVRNIFLREEDSTEYYEQK